MMTVWAILFSWTALRKVKNDCEVTQYLPPGFVKSKDDIKISTLLGSGRNQVSGIWIYLGMV